MVNPTNNNKTNINEIIDDNRVKAGKCGAIEMIVSAMKTHINNVDVCKHGCLALWNTVANNGKHQHHRTKTIRVECFSQTPQMITK